MILTAIEPGQARFDLKLIMTGFGHPLFGKMEAKKT
jgi:hypothetical protein